MNKHILALILIAGFITGTANAALIDDFSDGQILVSANGANTVVSSTAFGGSREVSIDKTGLLGATAAVNTNLAVYTHSADAFTSASSTISWTDTMGVDLIEGLTNNAFVLDILGIDQGNVNFILSISDIFNVESVTLLGAGAGIQNIAFTSFAGINFLQVTEVSLEIIGGEASDLTINSLTTSGTVPAPTELALLSVGLVAFGFNRRLAIGSPIVK